MARHVDTGRLRHLISGPRVDTRYHIMEAVVDKVTVDPAEGVFCDISLLPLEQPETAFLGVPYAGDGFGFYFPVEEDDIVLVAIPDGDPGAGPIIISRMWSAADKPFAELQGSADSDNPGQFHASSDVLLKAKSGSNARTMVSGGGDIRLEVTGGGDVEVNAAGSGIVKLQDGSQAFVRGNAFDGQLDTFLSSLETFTGAVSAMATGVAAYGTAVLAVSPATAAANTALQTALVTVFAPTVGVFTAACAAFRASSTTWLSTRVKGQ